MVRATTMAVAVVVGEMDAMTPGHMGVVVAVAAVDLGEPSNVPS